MAALDTPLLSGCYRVEVSGWDEDEMFFVEKSQLAGNDLTGRYISLQHKLAEGVGSEEARFRASLRPPLTLHVHISRMQH
jgi:hypothetical protein